MFMLNHLVGFGGSVGIGGNDASTKLLIHCDGANASTTFTDASSSAHTVTAAGNAQVSTAQSKFGGASLLCDGTGDYLTVTYSAALLIGTGDFTWEAWVRQTSAALNTIMSNRDGVGTTEALIFQAMADGTVRLVDETAVVLASAAGVFTAATWQHVAVNRTSGTLNIYVGGVQVATAANTTNFSGTANYRIGGDAGGAAEWNGHIDEVRISVGVGRFPSAFTPPNQPYG